LSSPCLGLSWLGLCQYNPAAPTSIYFSIGEVVGALAFTLAVQQLLKPIYHFRLNVRYLSLTHLYICVFVGVGTVAIAAVVPNVPFLHSGPWGYAVVWELSAGVLFVAAYGAVVLAIVRPVRVQKRRIEDFARGMARLLSAASEVDRVDVLPDLQRSLPVLIKAAESIEDRDSTSAFFDFIHRDTTRQAAFASTFLRIISDPLFCQTLVTRAPWQVVAILQKISEERLYTLSAKEFIREQYSPLGSFSVLGPTDSMSAALMERFNSAAERSYLTLIEQRLTSREQAAFGIASFYRTAFMHAWQIRTTSERDINLILRMGYGVTNAIKLANKLQASLPQAGYEFLFVRDIKQHRDDVLETLVEIVYEALTSIANDFKGFDDPFWHLAINVFHRGFPPFGEQPDGMTPFQQRLALKIMDKLRDNMRGYYPAICRVLLSCMGPYTASPQQSNRTAFNILKDAVYSELKRLQQFQPRKPNHIADYFPDQVTYDAATNQLTHTYRGGGPTITDLTALSLSSISLINPSIRRSLTDEERREAEQAM
jgi:hypothetical protein